MKTFVIIMLSIALLGNMLALKEYLEEHEGGKFIAGLIFLCAFILALIFACKL